MNRPGEIEPRQLAQRIVELETLFTHLQRTLHDLDGVILQQEKRLARLEQSIGALARQLATQADSAAEPRSLEDERPPHY